jgi:hypothetical protein
LDDEKHSEDYQRSPPTKYLEESPPHEEPDAFAQQQRDLLERLKEQFSSFPFHHVSGFPGLDLTTSSDHAQKIKSEAQNDFPFSSFPTPPPSKDEVKITSSASKKNGSSQNNNNSWSYEDQFKQVRQVSIFTYTNIQTYFQNTF